MNKPSERHRAVTRRVVALIALAIAVLFALPASAGTLHTSDDAGVLTPSQLATVGSRTQGYDFDVRLVTSSSYASKSDLGAYVHRFVTAPNLVVIGLDPVHRHVSVHFGTGTRIADSEFKTIESAGVDSFKGSDWAGGVVAILDRAEKAVGTGGGQRVAPVGTAGTAPASGGGFSFFWIIAIVGVIGLLFWIVSRRRGAGSPVGGYGGPPVGGCGGPPVGGYGGCPAGPRSRRRRQRHRRQHRVGGHRRARRLRDRQGGRREPPSPLRRRGSGPPARRRRRRGAVLRV